MAEIILQGPGLEPFLATLIEDEPVRCIVLFAVGRGGNPSRHNLLLRAIAGSGCTVIAPHFDMLASTNPTKSELDLRVRRLEAALDRYAHIDLPVFGVGHSIGATALLAIQGAEGETLDGRKIIVGERSKLGRLALLAPPTDFFRRPGALGRVRATTKIWVGEKDVITPPSQAFFLKDALEDQMPIEVEMDPHAGHFTYMNELPPNAPEPHPDRQTFLANLAKEIIDFLRV
jgi:hypothetical protein